MTVDEVVSVVTPCLLWARDNWCPLALTGEVVGSVLAVRLRRYRRCACWLLAALVTIWAGALD